MFLKAQLRSSPSFDDTLETFPRKLLDRLCTALLHQVRRLVKYLHAQHAALLGSPEAFVTRFVGCETRLGVVVDLSCDDDWQVTTAVDVFHGQSGSPGSGSPSASSPTAVQQRTVRLSQQAMLWSLATGTHPCCGCSVGRADTSTLCSSQATFSSV